MENNIKTYLAKLLGIVKTDFFKKFQAYMLGSIIGKMFSVVLFLWLGKVLKSEDFAVFAMYNFVVEMVSVFSIFGLATALVRLYVENREEVLFSSLVTIVLISTIIVFGISIFRFQIIELLGINYIFLKTAWVWFIIAIYIVSIKAIFNAYLVAAQKAKSYAIINVCDTFAYIVTVLSVYYIFKYKDYRVMIIGSIISFVPMMGYLSVMLLKTENKLICSWEKILSNLRNSVPFFLRNIIDIGNMYASRLVLDRIATPQELGVYSFFLMLYFKLNLVGMAITKVYSPKMLMMNTYNKERHDRLLNKLFAKALIILPALFIVYKVLMHIIGRNTLGLIFNKSYLDNIAILDVLIAVLLVGFLRILIGQYKLIKENAYKMLRISFYMLLLNIVVYYLSYEKFGLIGVPVGYLIISLITFILEMIMYRVDIDWKKLI